MRSGNSIIDRIYRALTNVPMWAMWLIVAVWTLPTVSLLVNSFRSRTRQRSSGFWQVGGDTDIDYVGVSCPASYRDPNEFHLFENYCEVLGTDTTNGLLESVISSFAIAVPATIIPIAVAAFAAYAFAWIPFKGRKPLFIATVSLLSIPLQVALIPLLVMFSNGAHLTIPFTERTMSLIPDFDLAGSSWAVVLTHTGFAMPFAIFLLHNYMSGLPEELIESARVDGADHFSTFMRLVLPLSIPALAAFGIFQFLWTWNDFLIAVTMLSSGSPDVFPTTTRIANLAGDFGQNEHLLTAGAFVQAFVPLVVFFSLQRYFVRGLLAGSVKG
ncbi:MAG: carbohydrate ABC transporter permease [Acidimicrobiia bacterium]|nr:carbohydrate ABC transporter permease [Acidimicrobiia bacterium]